MARISLGNRWGYIDKSGNIVIKPQFELAGNFSDGLAPVVSAGHLSFINKDGIKQFEVMGGVVSNIGILLIEFAEGLAPIQVGDKEAYIDKAGRFVIPPKFISAGRFSEGLAGVTVVTQQGPRTGYIDKAGNAIIPQLFSNAKPL
jgi:hypothetical protein